MWSSGLPRLTLFDVLSGSAGLPRLTLFHVLSGSTELPRLTLFDVLSGLLDCHVGLPYDTTYSSIRRFSTAKFSGSTFGEKNAGNHGCVIHVLTHHYQQHLYFAQLPAAIADIMTFAVALFILFTHMCISPQRRPELPQLYSRRQNLSPTSWSTVHLEKLIVTLLVKMFPTCHGNVSFITVFTRAKFFHSSHILTRFLYNPF
jgi:hypothetical protein